MLNYVANVFYCFYATFVTYHGCRLSSLCLRRDTRLPTTSQINNDLVIVFPSWAPPFPRAFQIFITSCYRGYFFSQLPHERSEQDKKKKSVVTPPCFRKRAAAIAINWPASLPCFRQRQTTKFVREESKF